MNGRDATASTARDLPLDRSPVAGCGVCAALVNEREEARTKGDIGTVGHRNGELSNCPHRRSTDRRPEVTS